MTNKEILMVIIKKAEKNGFDFNGWYKIKYHGNNTLCLNFSTRIKSIILLSQISELIFNHDFAKAFFGEYAYKWSKSLNNYKIINPGWKEYITRIALIKPEDRLKYFEKFLEE